MGEPLYLDVVAGSAGHQVCQHVLYYSGRYGLGSKDTTPAQIDRCLQQRSVAGTAQAEIHHRYR